MFFNIEDANIFAEKEKISFEKVVTYNLSDIIGLIGNVDSSENCRVLIDTWNFFSDLSKSLNEKYIGDLDDETMIDIYNKLFYGCNLKLLKNEEYHPIFDDIEVHTCSEIFLSGLSILKKQLKLNNP